MGATALPIPSVASHHHRLHRLPPMCHLDPLLLSRSQSSDHNLPVAHLLSPKLSPPPSSLPLLAMSRAAISSAPVALVAVHLSVLPNSAGATSHLPQSMEDHRSSMLPSRHRPPWPTLTQAPLLFSVFRIHPPSSTVIHLPSFATFDYYLAITPSSGPLPSSHSVRHCHRLLPPLTSMLTARRPLPDLPPISPTTVPSPQHHRHLSTSVRPLPCCSQTTRCSSLFHPKLRCPANSAIANRPSSRLRPQWHLLSPFRTVLLLLPLPSSSPCSRATADITQLLLHLPSLPCHFSIQQPFNLIERRQRVV